MPKETFVCYALPATDAVPYEHVGHFVEGAAPEGARVIDAAEAKRINDDVDSRTPPRPAIEAQLAASIDLKPLLDKIDALSKTVIAQADELDKVHQKVDDQASDIAKVREDTKEAVKQLGAV